MTGITVKGGASGVFITGNGNTVGGSRNGAPPSAPAPAARERSVNVSLSGLHLEAQGSVVRLTDDTPDLVVFVNGRMVFRPSEGSEGEPEPPEAEENPYDQPDELHAAGRGWAAFLAGEPQAVNPFEAKLYPKCREAWDGGWTGAQADAERIREGLEPEGPPGARGLATEPAAATEDILTRLAAAARDDGAPEA